MNADGEKTRAMFENHEFLSFSVHPRLSAVEIIFQKKKMLPDCNTDERRFFLYALTVVVL